MPTRHDRERHDGGETPQFTRRRTFTAAPPPPTRCCAVPSSAPSTKADTTRRTSERRPHACSAGLRRATSAPTFTRREVVPLSGSVPAAPDASLNVTPAHTSSLEGSAQAAGAQLVTEALHLAALCVGASDDHVHTEPKAATLEWPDTVTLRRLRRVRLPRLSSVSDNRGTDTCVCTVLHASMLMACSLAAFAATVCDTSHLDTVFGRVSSTNAAAHMVQTFNDGAQALVHLQPHRETATAAADAVLFTALGVCDDCSSRSTPSTAAELTGFRAAERRRRGGDDVADVPGSLLVCAATSAVDAGVPLRQNVRRLELRHLSWVASADGAPPTQCTRVHCIMTCAETATESAVLLSEANLRQALRAMADAGRAQRTCAPASQEVRSAKHPEEALGGLCAPHFTATRRVNCHHLSQAPTHPTRSPAPSSSNVRPSSPPSEWCERRAAYFGTLAKALRDGACTLRLDSRQVRTTSADGRGVSRRSRSHAGVRPPPPGVQPQRIRRTTSAMAPPLADRTRAPEHLAVCAATAAETSSPSPEPCVPLDSLSAKSAPRLSPIRPGTHDAGTDREDAASLCTYEPSVAAPSMLTSLRLARLVGNSGVDDALRFSVRTTQQQRSDNCVTRATDAHTPQALARSRQLHPDNVVRHVTRSKGRLGGGPEALMHTQPPHKRREEKPRANAQDVVAGPLIRVWVHGIHGLPREAIRTRPGATETAAATEVYVYAQSNTGDRRRRKTACVPYAASVAFPSAELLFPQAQDDVQDERKNDVQQTLTFTVAVHLSTGTQVKLGVACVGLCNLQDGVATPVSLPVVAKAGTPRARERGELAVTLQPAGFGRSAEHAPEMEEAVVRRAVQDALRHGYPEELHKAELLVREHCRDSLAQLHDVVSQLRRGKLPRARPSLESSDAASQREEKKASESDSFAAPSRRGSSPFTSLVLDDPRQVHRSLSCTAASQPGLVAKAATVETVGEAPARSSVPGGGERVAVRCALLRLLSAPSSIVSSAGVAPSARQAPPATTVPTCELAVTVHAVRNLVDAFGLPLQSCASLFLRLHALPARDLTQVDDQAAHTTAAVLYDGQSASFGDTVVRFTRPACSDGFELCCTAFSGMPSCCEELGVCHVRASWPSSAAPQRARGEAFEVKVIRFHGSLHAHVCGDLVITVSGSSSSSSSSDDDDISAVQKSSEPVGEAHAARLQRHVLGWLWRYGRRQLHRIDGIVQAAAAASSCGDALAEYLELPANVCSSQVGAVAPDFLLTIELAAVGGQTFPAAADGERVPQGRVFVAWSCGAFAGRSAEVGVHPCGPAATLSARFGEVLRLPDSDSLDAAELCVAVYGVRPPADTSTPVYTEELCRTHVSFRSVRSCRVANQRSPSAVVQLPLVWRAGERGAYERGFVQLRVASAPCRAAERSPGPWMGFSAQWPPRVALRQLLCCYSTERLHRTLCLLASADHGGRGESYDDSETAMRMVHALERAWGPVSGGVSLRVGLLGFRPLPEAAVAAAASTTFFHGCSAYLQVYHRGRAVLRTPTLRCCGTAVAAGRHPSLSLPEFEGRTRVLPLLDEDKCLLRLTTTAPHHERLVLRAKVEHPLRRNVVMACAELGLAAFVSPADVSTHGDEAGAPRRRYCWVPLQDERHETVAEVGVRVEWAPAATVAAASSAAVAPATPLDRSAAAAQDVLSLLHTYQPAAVSRLAAHLGRFPGPAVAHRRLRQEVLQTARIVATVYVDVAGISPRTGAAARRAWATFARAESGLHVSASYLGCTSPLPCPCRCLSDSAARATVEAARLLGGSTHADNVHGGELWVAWRHSLRLDLQLPTPTTTADAAVGDELCLRFTAPDPTTTERAARAASASPRTRHQSRSSSADKARPVRSRSALAPSSLASCAVDTAAPSDRPAAAAQVAQVEVGRVWLSLKALCTVPELYRNEELTVLPLVTHGRTNGGDPVVLGDVYLRVRMPAHESVPPWLRYSDAEASAARRGGSLGPYDLHGQLRRQQLQCERHLSAHADRLASLHATFFRQCVAVPTATPSVTEMVAKKPHATGAAQSRGRSPLPTLRGRSAATASSPPSSVAEEVRWRVHEVQPRPRAAAAAAAAPVAASDAGRAKVALFQTPTPKEMPSRSDGVSEAGGATGGAGSSWARGSSPSLRLRSPSVTGLETKRELIF